MPIQPTRLRQGAVGPESFPRAITAIVITCIMVILVPLMVAMIGYRSIMVHGPTTAIVVCGDSTVDGAKIEVTEMVGQHLKWSATIDRANEYQTPILLEPGRYHVTVTHMGRQILSEVCSPDHLNGVRFELKSMVTIKGSPALLDGKIEILYAGDNSQVARSTPVTLSAESHYRERVYLYPGDYRAVARPPSNPVGVLAQVDFKVDRLSPAHVDLSKPPSTEIE